MGDVIDHLCVYMAVDLFPPKLRLRYEIHEWKHACAILHADFPNEWDDLLALLEAFHLCRSSIITPGGSKSAVARSVDQFLASRGWVEKDFATSIRVDDITLSSPTHKVDCFKNRVALEVEWNNKDPFFDRDLNNFRLLFDLRVISVGIIFTRSDHLQDLFNRLERGSSYGASTTHISKLLPRIEGGGGGGCPLLAIGITEALYREDC